MQKKLNEDFIEKYSQQFAAKISEDFYASHSHIGGQEILGVTPSKQVNFFVIKLLFNNWQQESQRLESPFFNYGAIEVKEALLQFMNVLSRFIQVERKEFELLLQDAVRESLFLIMAPKVYLEIEFDRKGTKVLSERMAKNILKYVKISKTDFDKYFQANIGIKKDDLSIDESIVSDAILAEEIAKLNEVIPLTLTKLEEGEEDEASEDQLRFEKEEEKEEKEKEEIEGEEKNELKTESGVYASPTIARASQSKEKVRENIQEEMEEQVDEGSTKTEEETEKIADNRIVVEEVGIEDDEEIAEESEVKEIVEAENVEVEEETIPIEGDEKTSADQIDDNINGEEEENEEEPTSEPEASSPSDEYVITNMAPEEDDGEADDTLNDKFDDPLAVPTIAESHEGQADNMMAAISVNHRYMFINELFDGDADLFTQAVGKVETSTSFDESVEILVQNYAKEFHWDMNSDEVKELLKIIFRRFR